MRTIQDTEQPRARLTGDFMRLWSASTISNFGTAVTTVALPIVAVVTLQASTFEVGVISAAAVSAWLLLGLSAGVWVERMTRRPLMIACDLGRAAALVSVPVAAVLDTLTVVHLVAVALVIGVGSVFYDIASQTYLPTILPPEQLGSGNSKLQASQAVSHSAGPSIGGVLVQAVGAAYSLLADVVSYLLSAVLLSSVRGREAPRPRGEPKPMWPQIREGLAYVWTDRVFRPLTLVAASLNMLGAAFDTLLIPFLVREVRVSPAAIGVLLAVGGLGAFFGAAIGPWSARRIGSARSLVIAAVAGPPLGLLVPGTYAGIGLSLFVVGLLGREAGIALFSLQSRTFRQLTAPPELLARITATIRFVSWGVLPIGALAGGVLGQLMGTRPALWVICATLLLTPLPLAFLSVRKLQELIDEATGAPAGNGASA